MGESMKNTKYHYLTDMEKDFYRISKERLAGYMTALDEIRGIIHDIEISSYKAKEVNDKLKIVQNILISLWNSLWGFKHYEEYEATGIDGQDWWTSQSDHIDDYFSIEFPNGIDRSLNKICAERKSK